MILSILFIIAFVICSLLINLRNRITWIFSVYFTGIAILLFASILYIAKTSNYYYSLSIDYYLYLFMSDIKLRLSDISRIHNFGVAIIMFASFFFFITIKKFKNWNKFLMLIPILIYMLSNDPITYYNAFIEINSFNDNVYKQLIPLFLSANNIFSDCILVIYMLLPFYAIIVYSKNTKIRLKIKYSLISAVCLIVVDIFIFAFFIKGPFGSFMTSNVDLFKFPVTNINWSYIVVIQPIIMFIILIVLYLTFHYKPFNTLSVLTQKDIMKNSQLLNKNLRMIFHVYKNLFFTIDRLSKQGQEVIETNKQLTINNLEEINKISQESVSTIAKMLNMLSELKFTHHKTNIVKCINNALEKVCIPNYIKIIKNFDEDEIMVYADDFYLTESFVNLFSNSLDAIALKGNTDAFIKVDTYCEEDLVSVEVTDNGCGISKKNVKDIFRILYSTKQNSKNWGVGLNYVDKVIKFYRGSIFVKSEEGEYTFFQIVLPLLTQKEGKK